MFERTKHYSSENSKELIGQIEKEGFVTQFMEAYFCLYDLAKADEKQSFQNLVECVIKVHQEKNPIHNKDHVKHIVLSRLEGLCIQIDQGRLVIGLPIISPEKPGKAQALFLDLYGAYRLDDYKFPRIDGFENA